MNRSILIALVMAAAMAAWLLSGALAGDGEEAAGQAPAAQEGEAAPMKVRVRDSTASAVVRRVVVQGQLEPLRSVEVKAETGGTVASLPVEKGRAVATGEVIAMLSEDTRRERVAEAQALLAQRRAELAAAERLGREGLQSENALRQARAQQAAAEAALAAVRLELARIRITAPFDGVLDRRPVELGAMLDRGDVVATVAEVDRLLATAQVPQQAVHGLELGATVTVVPAGGEAVEGSIRYIAAVADAATRSFRIEAVVDNSDRRLVAGMSATLEVPVERVRAHFVSPALLTLGEDGRVGVMAVEDGDRAAFHAVRLVRSERGGAWVAGLPEQIRLITLGQGFVAAGQRVVPVPEPDGQAQATEAPA
jgi:multidrug efflux system membrane fusion protein